MSLNFDISKIAENVKHNRDGSISLVTRTMIFATMNTGIGEITEDNAAEFYARASTWESVFGAARGSQSGDIFITPQEVRDHIGLTTNVFPKESDTAWRKRLVDYALSERQRRYALALAELPVTGNTEQKAG